MTHARSCQGHAAQTRSCTTKLCVMQRISQSASAVTHQVSTRSRAWKGFASPTSPNTPTPTPTSLTTDCTTSLYSSSPQPPSAARPRAWEHVAQHAPRGRGSHLRPAQTLQPPPPPPLPPPIPSLPARTHPHTHSRHQARGHGCGSLRPQTHRETCNGRRGLAPLDRAYSESERGSSGSAIS